MTLILCTFEQIGNVSYKRLDGAETCARVPIRRRIDGFFSTLVLVV